MQNFFQQSVVSFNFKSITLKHKYCIKLSKAGDTQHGITWSSVIKYTFQILRSIRDKKTLFPTEERVDKYITRYEINKIFCSENILISIGLKENLETSWDYLQL